MSSLLSEVFHASKLSLDRGVTDNEAAAGELSDKDILDLEARGRAAVAAGEQWDVEAEKQKLKADLAAEAKRRKIELKMATRRLATDIIPSGAKKDL